MKFKFCLKLILILVSSIQFCKFLKQYNIPEGLVPSGEVFFMDSNGIVKLTFRFGG